MLMTVIIGVMLCAASDQYPDPLRFEESIRAFEARDRKDMPPQNAIVFVGSSSIGGWHKWLKEDMAPLTVIPRGFGGSNMNDALHYVDRIVITYRPRAVVLYEGDNDIAHGITPERIRETFLAFVARVHEKLPDARIYVLSIKPSVQRWHMWREMTRTNALLAEECARNKSLIYVDLASGMLDDSGRVRTDIFLEDELHMNRKGYLIWRKILRPILIERELKFERMVESR